MNDVWNNLKVDQKGRLMDIYLKAGITSLDEMKDHFNRYMDESAIEDPAGQWAHPGKITRIPSGEITMKGVPYPVLGVSDTGDTKMMYPDRDYSFKGNSVTEYPMYQNGGHIYEVGGMKSPIEHWDPSHPHFHMSQDGTLLPADYEGSDNAYQLEAGINDPKLLNAVSQHQSVMDNDRYKYVENPEYRKLNKSLDKAKKIYDWGNASAGLSYNPNKTRWQHEWIRPELTFDENGIGYDSQGMTYLPRTDVVYHGTKSVSVPGPSPTSYSQNYMYYPTVIPEKQILRTEFPYILIINKADYDAEKQRAIDEYMNNNTIKQVNNIPDKIEYEPYGHYEDWVYPIRHTYFNDKQGKISKRLEKNFSNIIPENSFLHDYSNFNPYILKYIDKAKLKVKDRNLFSKQNSINVYARYNPLTKKYTFFPKKTEDGSELKNFHLSMEEKKKDKFKRIPDFNPIMYKIPFDGKPDILDEKGLYDIKKNNIEYYKSFSNGYTSIYEDLIRNENKKVSDTWNTNRFISRKPIPTSMTPVSHKGIPLNFVNSNKFNDQNLFESRLRDIWNNKVTQGADKIITSLFHPIFDIKEEDRNPYFFTSKIPVDRNVIIEGYKPKIIQKGSNNTIITKPSYEEAEQNAVLNYGNLLNNQYQYGGDMVLSGGNMIRAKDERMASRLAGVPESYISNAVYDSGSKSYIPVYNLRPVNVTARTPSYIMSLSPEERENLAKGETYAQEFSRRHNETGKKFMPLAMTAAAAPLAAFAEPIAAVARPITTVASKPFGTALNAVGRIAPKLSSRYASQAALADGIYDIAMTADGVRNAFSDEGIQKTARLAEEGDVYGAVKSGIGDIMNLAGAYSTTNKIAAVARPKTRYDAVYDMTVPVVRTIASTKPGKRMAESVMRASSNSNLDASDVKSALKNNVGYIFTGKNPKFGFYNGTEAGGKARKDDLISAYLYGNKLNSKRADFMDNISYGVHDDYVMKNYPHLYGKIPVYEVGDVSGEALHKLSINPLSTSVDGPMSYRTNNHASDDFGYDTAGHMIVHDNGDVYEQDIWKFNPAEYRNKYGYDDRNTMMINDLGLNFIDAAGTPVILRSKPMKNPYR